MHVAIYARWSSLEQGKGSTLERQIAAGETLAAERGWTTAERVIDRGKSAYTGSNITTGELGQFAARLDTLTNPILIVEELDRLSRQPADVMLTWLSPLVRRGLTIIVTSTGQTIDRNMLDHDMGGLMMLLITAFGSHKESAKKAQRVGAAWDKKRRDAEAGNEIQRRHRAPAWLSVDDRGQFVVADDRLAIVQRIFCERLAGAGKASIAKRLNADRVATWGTTSKVAEAWSATYVGRVLTNRAVMGWWQPHIQPRGGARQPIGEEIKIYPQIIDEETFARANDKRAENQRRHQGRGKSLSNLLGSRARCGSCGGQMAALGSSRYRTNKDGSTSRHYFLYCQNAKVAKTCDNQRGWTYDRVEAPLLDHVLTLAMDDQDFTVGSEATRLEGLVFTARANVTDLEAKLSRLLDILENGGPVAARYRERQIEYDAAKDKLHKLEDDLASARGAVTPDEHLRRVQEVRAMMMSDDLGERYQARIRVKAALHDLIKTMRFEPLSGNVHVDLIEGVRSITIRADGEVWDFDLVHPGRECTTSNPDVKAYLRRTKT